MEKKLAISVLVITLAIASASVRFVNEVDDSGLSQNFYRHSCPRAETLIRSTVTKLYGTDPRVAAAIIRLVFHDCFVHGCDGSVLLNSTNGFRSEKEAKPNLSLKGFDVIDMIKHKIEEECPATVSCSDILVLAARDAVFLIGGPHYELKTGRRDSHVSHFEEAFELPGPDADLSEILSLFVDRGFDERETVALLGGHNVGTIHCEFVTHRLTNFSGTGKPDPSIERSFLKIMMSKCINHQKDREKPGLDMSLEAEAGQEFGTHYYDSLIQGKGILHADQQLMISEGTASWVRTYKSDQWLFQEDFADVMIKLSNHKVLTKPYGQIRRHCSLVAGKAY